MTFLVGQVGAGYATDVGVQSSSGNSFWYEPATGDGYIAVASGTATTMYFYASSWPTAPSVKGAVYDTSRNLIAVSGVISAPTTGLVSASISVAITSGSEYFLVIIPNGGYVDARTSAAGPTNQTQNGIVNYASPTDPLPAGSPQTGREFIVWLDGTVGASVTVNPISGRGGAAAQPVVS